MPISSVGSFLVLPDSDVQVGASANRKKSFRINDLEQQLKVSVYVSLIWRHHYICVCVCVLWVHHTQPAQ